MAGWSPPNNLSFFTFRHIYFPMAMPSTSIADQNPVPTTMSHNTPSEKHVIDGTALAEAQPVNSMVGDHCNDDSCGAAHDDTYAMDEELIEEREEDIPPDEHAFIVPPHFSPRNPFHKHLSEFDLSMRCKDLNFSFHS